VTITTIEWRNVPDSFKPPLLSDKQQISSSTQATNHKIVCEYVTDQQYRVGINDALGRKKPI